MKVYIAGPMTGYEDWNRPAFYAAAEHLRANGFEVVNPAELDEGFTDEQLASTPHADFLRRDIVALLDCQAIYFLPGARWSKGAMLERTVSEGTGIFELVEPNLELWRTFEGRPLDEKCCTPACDEMHTFDAPCELAVSPETREFAGIGASPFAGIDLDVIVDNSMPEGVIRLETPEGHIDFTLTEDLSGLEVVGVAPAPAETEDLPVSRVDCEAVEGDGTGNEWCSHGVQVAWADPAKPEDTGGIAVDDDDPHLYPWQQAFARYFFGVLGGRA